jgi:hypothetical protein
MTAARVTLRHFTFLSKGVSRRDSFEALNPLAADCVMWPGVSQSLGRTRSWLDFMLGKMAEGRQNHKENKRANILT